MNSIESRTFQVVADVLGIPVEEVNINTSHDTVADWDSMNMINILMALESEFDLELGIEDAARIQSVSDIFRILHDRGAR